MIKIGNMSKYFPKEKTNFLKPDSFKNSIIYTKTKNSNLDQNNAIYFKIEFLNLYFLFL